MTATLAVFISGSGRTMENLVRRCEDGSLDARVELVIASRDCRGVDLARKLGVSVILHRGEMTAAQLEQLVRDHTIDLVILAGYLRRLPIPPQLEGRILNIHPALLPGDGTSGRFGGRGMHGEHVHRAVIEAGERETGCTVHHVTADYDTGPVVLRSSCEVMPDDTPDALAARVFQLELEAYPRAISMVIADRNAAEADSHAKRTV